MKISVYFFSIQIQSNAVVGWLTKFPNNFIPTFYLTCILPVSCNIKKIVNLISLFIDHNKARYRRMKLAKKSTNFFCFIEIFKIKLHNFVRNFDTIKQRNCCFASRSPNFVHLDQASLTAVSRPTHSQCCLWDHVFSCMSYHLY